ncbi:MAG: hypothetical protein L6Q35_00455 [Phycisphaerales bacterium]|nr:hypothetical protein [Phycisphaerales bacterium]
MTIEKEWTKLYCGAMHLESNNGRQFATVEVYSHDFAEVSVFSWETHRHSAYRQFYGDNAVEDAKQYAHKALSRFA